MSTTTISKAVYVGTDSGNVVCDSIHCCGQTLKGSIVNAKPNQEWFNGMYNESFFQTTVAEFEMDCECDSFKNVSIEGA
jgi:hypothetical protein